MSILRKGMRGAPVKRLQEALGVEADGIFGSGTEKALKAAQSDAGIAADGIAGPDTFTALGLNELVLLRVGTRGEAVKRLQTALGIEADGRFGPGTEKAVRAFQEANGLTPDGMAGPATLARIDAFPEVTVETVEKAAVTPAEEVFEGEPMPEIKGVEVVTGSVVALPEKESVWSRVKGWFSSGGGGSAPAARSGRPPGIFEGRCRPGVRRAGRRARCGCGRRGRGAAPAAA